MNLSAHVDEILKSGAVDSIKIEGRTKSPYYAAITAYTYKMAINDFYNDCFDSKKYERELNTTKNRGFTDAYLIHKPFDKHDTQNHHYAMSVGTYEVSGLVIEDKKHFMCKYKTTINEDIEIFAPYGSQFNEVDNEIGKVFKKDGQYYINFKQIVTQSGKNMDAVHSGNTNPIVLPCELPYLTMFRVEAKDGEESCKVN